MCGIWARILKGQVSCSAPQKPKNSTLWAAGVNTLEARGPEGHKWLDLPDGTWCFTRLAINGLNTGAMQPFSMGSSLAWMCNGEIYNAKELEGLVGVSSATGSDCEVLGELYKFVGKDPVKFARALDGVFAIMIYDYDAGAYIVARDPYGVRPLFYMEGLDGWHFASERKALEPFADAGASILEFPPGEVWMIKADRDSVVKRAYHEVPWMKQTAEQPLSALRAALVSAVDKRLMTERPVAALLSGGVDSSLIAALVQKRLKELGKPPLKTFSIGMAGGTDLFYARMVATYIGSDHHEVIVTEDEMFDCIPEVIRDIESYDITTVRASVGNWMIAREIRRTTECKVVFNGDGSDEIFGSYMYFYRAPNDFAFEEETKRLLREIHQYDVLRSDRSISSHGLEARTPFLDKQFVAAAMSYPTKMRRPVKGRQMEKVILRDAFAKDRLLPVDVLYRTKEAFSDGVSSQAEGLSWYEIIQKKIEQKGLVADSDLGSHGTGPVPKTKEAYYYRSIYDRLYKHTGWFWPYWMPKWSPDTQDPSARTLTK
jgi:asparagine synthase (glutamine-hydrolysing)